MELARYVPSWIAIVLAVATSIFGAVFWHWRNGRPRKLDAPGVTDARIHRVTALVKAASSGGKQGRLGSADYTELLGFYERWLNLPADARSQMREELATEGIDMIKLGDAIRSDRLGPV
ncbi:MAG: hypothetical protein HOW73_26155 [Polyangiaceae bacterium]|nr:hypothetical protein [Polyangiaceae bacterium]